MIVLRTASGNPAGVELVVRRFPCRIGRAKTAHLRLLNPGVWDKHAEVVLDRSKGFVLKTSPGATTLLNGEPVAEARLRNGDSIGFGGADVKFWLGPASQPGLALREALTWLALAGLTASQVVLMYWLTH